MAYRVYRDLGIIMHRSASSLHEACPADALGKSIDVSRHSLFSSKHPLSERGHRDRNPEQKPTRSSDLYRRLYSAMRVG